MPTLNVKNIVLVGHFEDSLPDTCPDGFTVSDRFPGWGRQADGFYITVHAIPKKVMFVGHQTNDIEGAMLRSIESLEGLGLPPVMHLRVDHLVTHYESGMPNPVFAKASSFDTQKEDRQAKDIADIKHRIDRQKSVLKELETAVFTGRYAAKKEASRDDRIRGLTDKIETMTKRLARLEKKAKRSLGHGMRVLVLEHGKVMVFDSGAWTFCGQTSMEEVHQDLAEASMLIQPSMPDMSALSMQP